MSLLRRLLGLCEHHWEDKRELGDYKPGNGCGGAGKIRLGLTQRCSKCGDYRTVWH